MPLYEYICDKCKEEFIINHAINEKQENCAFCESENIRKKWSISKEPKENKKSTLKDEEKRARKELEKFKEQLKKESENWIK